MTSTIKIKHSRRDGRDEDFQVEPNILMPLPFSAISDTIRIEGAIMKQRNRKCPVVFYEILSANQRHRIFMMV